MKLIKIKNHYYLLSREEPKLFDTVICPVIKNNVWDGKSFEVDSLTSDLMALYPNEFNAVKTIVASTEDLTLIPKIKEVDLLDFGIKKQYTYDDLVDLVGQLMDYTKEGRVILGHEEREPYEFVDIFVARLDPTVSETTEWEVLADLTVINGYVKILRVTKEKFIIWGTYDNWKDKNANRLSQDYDKLVKQGYNKTYNFYCCGRWDDSEL